MSGGVRVCGLVGVGWLADQMSVWVLFVHVAQWCEEIDNWLTK